ncbi:nucleotidyl transferase AbiEii/AbiGii toxin family protein [Streptomyces sp. P9(2023)]|uniref:nucleotidyl transferase AbiEii/AbiGii toxin family protein n=1 Tax=Streptomyces sp. P9(2023) TaxID=3064394 RepID=UPI0028F3EBD6|nr:nucleotidyl transferase AbiEii/AbiGii toxin family protein [Streptomyces sp. P9(2023)]MDT9692739.1 nucleotidyl transferase AbiEii/AbiGii toxin family protein [Streptomyces sp. P9(2023)]
MPGHRLVLPWTAPGLPGGQVQLDFVFQERLPTPHRPTEVAGARLLAADRELSLAWKLMWLSCDMYPQAKDLYDAVLLAESCALPLTLLETALHEADEWPGHRNEPLNLGMVENAVRETDWMGFDDAHPDTEAARRDLGPVCWPPSLRCSGHRSQGPSGSGRGATAGTEQLYVPHDVDSGHERKAGEDEPERRHHRQRVSFNLLPDQSHDPGLLIGHASSA